MTVDDGFGASSLHLPRPDASNPAELSFRRLLYSTERRVADVVSTVDAASAQGQDGATMFMLPAVKLSHVSAECLTGSSGDLHTDRYSVVASTRTIHGGVLCNWSKLQASYAPKLAACIPCMHACACMCRMLLLRRPLLCVFCMQYIETLRDQLADLERGGLRRWGCFLGWG